MMDLITYQALIRKIGLEKLNEGHKEIYDLVKDGSHDFENPEVWIEMLVSSDVKDIYETHIKELKKLEKGEQTSEVENVAVATKPKTKKVKKVKEPKKKVKPEPKKIKPKKPPVKTKSKAKVKAKRTFAKRILKPKPEPVKFPVTVKRFSKELQLMKRFKGMDGKEKSVKGLQLFHNLLKSTLKQHPDHRPVVGEMHKRLSTMLGIVKEKSLTHVIFNIDAGFKDKLVQNIKNARPRLKVEYLAGVEKKSPVESKIGSLKGDSLFQSISSVDKNTKPTFRLKGGQGEFLGDLETYKLAISIEGDQGGGKTQLAFQLMDGFADIGYNVGMFQLEIGANSNIVSKFRDKYIKPANINKIKIAGEAPNGIDTIREYARKFDVIIIDSWTKLNVDSQEFDRLRNDFPDTIWIVLFQRTSGNTIRGGTKPLYDAGINIEVVKVDDTFVNNYAVATKNRYGRTGLKYNISKKKITEYETAK
jgi:hypothetical protein